MTRARGCGLCGAALYALRSTSSGLTFMLTRGAVVAFVIAALLAWSYWHLVIRLAFSDSGRGPGGTLSPRDRRKFVLFSALLIVLGVGGFLYPLRFVPNERLSDVVQGLVIAAACVAFIAAALWRLSRFLEKDAAHNDDPSRTDS